jgi:signal transduction histidine kinase/CheY-like chemotaxis protein
VSVRPPDPSAPVAASPGAATTIGLNVALALAYWALAEITLSAVSSAGRIAPLWPPAGLVLLAVYRWGPRVLPGVFAGSALTMAGRAAAAAVIGVSLATVVQVVIEIAVLKRLRFDPALDRVRDAGVLGLAAAPSGSAVSASLAVPSLYLAGVLPVEGLAYGWLLWWLRNWLGSLLVGSFGLAWAYGRRLDWTRWRVAEAVVLMAALAALTSVGVGAWRVLGGQPVPVAFAFFPLFTWAGLRFGARGAATLTMLAGAIALVAATMEGGPFRAYSLETTQVLLHAFLMLGALTGLVIAGVMAEREEELRRRLALEAQLRHSQKMEAVGRLAGGIAHDFNNLLTAIIGYNEIVLQTLAAGDPAREDAEEVGRAAARAAELTRQMLAFSRRQVLQPQVVNLNTVVSQVEPLLRRVLGEDVVMSVVSRAVHPLVCVDRGQIEQVIMNMVVNARDAMPGGGRLTVETADLVLDEAAARGHRGSCAGTYVVLVISDTGIGMSPETRARIFDPYFTTKEVGKGTGLGLSTAHGIVEQSGGYITVDSEPGVGTTFRVHLPRADVHPEPEAETTASAMAGGSERILLVEDDQIVRRLSRDILARLGYSVTEAASGKAALALAGDDTRQFDLLFCDVVLGDINGPAVAEAVRAVRPAVRVLFMSGYTDEAIARTGMGLEGAPFLQKPFTPEQLAQKVREVLDEPDVLPRV